MVDITAPVAATGYSGLYNFISNSSGTPLTRRILRPDTASQITPLSRESFFTPLWRTVKNRGRAGSGQEDKRL